MLRLADRAVLQERGQQFLLPEVKVTLLLLCSLGFVFRHFALSFTLITYVLVSLTSELLSH